MMSHLSHRASNSKTKMISLFINHHITPQMTSAHAFKTGQPKLAWTSGLN